MRSSYPQLFTRQAARSAPGLAQEQLGEPLGRGGWRTRLGKTALQHPLFETRSSLSALARVERARPPRTVFVGFGLASAGELSAALPMDALGMLLAAELARRSVGAERLAVLVADAHALGNGLAHGAVARRADEQQRMLQRIRERFDWTHMRVFRAQELQHKLSYRSIHERIEALAPRGEDPYFVREVTDIEYFDRHHEGILKVGWALGPSLRGAEERDERAFDQRFRDWLGHHVPFVYCKAGRVLHDQRPRAAPYFEPSPERRICLQPDEPLRTKLGAPGASLSTVRGVRNHLKALARAYSQLIRPLHGTLEDRLQTILDDIFCVDAPLQPRWQSHAADGHLG